MADEREQIEEINSFTCPSWWSDVMGKRKRKTERERETLLCCSAATVCAIKEKQIPNRKNDYSHLRALS